MVLQVNVGGATFAASSGGAAGGAAATPGRIHPSMCLAFEALRTRKVC